MSDTPSELLARRADSFHDQVLEVACGPGGMLVSLLRYDTRRPFQEGEPMHPYLTRSLEELWGTASPTPTLAEWYYGENTLWATGWFLWSQLLRHRATGEAEALETARKCFRDLSSIFRLCRELEPGLLGKPHGGRAGPTTSFDQSACPVLFYVQFAREHGTPEEKAEAARNMADHGEYYLRHDWVMNHHGHLARINNPAHTSCMKYFACVHAAYEMTGEIRFRDAAFEQVRQLLRTGKLPWPSNPYEINHNFFYYALLSDYWLKTDLAADADWKNFIREYWVAAQASLDGGGLVRCGIYETALHAFTPYPDRWMTPEDRKTYSWQAPAKPGARRWVSSTSYPNRSICCAFAACLGLLARTHGLDDRADQPAQRILARMDDDSMRWWWDDGKLPLELKPVLNIFAPEVPAAWLCAYWLGRLQKAW
ncbi:MAG: hypothetical protein HYU36_13985 [Planctomycetes bacterium]|nr:hypothetical protein [Planctomycetota bacterium]